MWNRAAGRLRLFKTDRDYLAFEKILVEAHERFPLPLLDWCIMPNHWRFAVQPENGKQVTEFFRWLTQIHAMRWHAAHGSVDMGPLYQGRFKSLPVQADAHLLTLLRYVGRNPLRGKLVKRAADWRWSGEHIRQHGPAQMRALLSDWPVKRPRDWSRRLNEPQTDAEIEALRTAFNRSRPFGQADWVTATARKLGLNWTLRPRGRPAKTGKGVRPL